MQCATGVKRLPPVLCGLHTLIALAFVFIVFIPFVFRIYVLCFSRIYRTWTAGALFAAQLWTDMKIQATPTSKNCSHIRRLQPTKMVGTWCCG